MLLREQRNKEKQDRVIFVKKHEKCTVTKARISKSLFLQASIRFLMTDQCWGDDDEVSIGDCAVTSSTVLGLIFSSSGSSSIRGPYKST